MGGSCVGFAGYGCLLLVASYGICLGLLVVCLWVVLWLVVLLVVWRLFKLPRLLVGWYAAVFVGLYGVVLFVRLRMVGCLVL